MNDKRQDEESVNEEEIQLPLSGGAMERIMIELREIFAKRPIIYSAIYACAFFVMSMIAEYRLQLQKLDNAAQGAFGVRLSSEFGFFETLRLTGFNYPIELVGTIFIAFLPALTLRRLVEVNVINQQNAGWKRIAITSLLASAVFALLKAKGFLGFAAVTLLVSNLFLVGILLIRWVGEGFASGKPRM